MNKKELETYLGKWIKSWSGNEPQKLIKFYSANAYFQDPLNPKGLTKKKEIEPYFKKLLAKNPNWEWEITEVIPNKKGCIVKTEAVVPHKKKKVKVSCVDILEMKGKKIVRNEVYFDRSKLK